MSTTIRLTLLASLFTFACTTADSDPGIRTAFAGPSRASGGDTGGSDSGNEDPEDTGSPEPSCPGSYADSVSTNDLTYDQTLGAYVVPLSHEVDVEVKGCLDAEEVGAMLFFRSNGSPTASESAYKDIDAVMTEDDDEWLIAISEGAGFVLHFSPAN